MRYFSQVAAVGVDHSGRVVIQPRRAAPAGLSGRLTAVGFNTTFGTAADRTIQIYEGQGTGGTLLATEAGVTMLAAGGLEKFDLSTPPVVTAGQQYTIRVSGNNNALNLNAAGGYAGGQYSENAAQDLEFATWVAGSGNLFTVDDTSDEICLLGPVKLGNSGVPSVTDEHLYNSGGDLFWQGTQLNTGGGGGGGFDTVMAYGNPSGSPYQFSAFKAAANGSIVDAQVYSYSTTREPTNGQSTSELMERRF